MSINNSKVKNRVLSGQSREIIASVIQFMSKEARAGTPIISLAKAQERVAAATGVSLRTVKRIKQEAIEVQRGERSAFSTPNEKRERRSKLSLDEFDLGVLRRTIINYHITEKKVPTVRGIHKKFSEDIGYQGSRETLRKEIAKLGFRWRKINGDRKCKNTRKKTVNESSDYSSSDKEYLDSDVTSSESMSDVEEFDEDNFDQPEPGCSN